MTRLICRRTSALGLAFAVMGRHTAKRTLIDFAIFRPGKRYAVVFEFYNCRNGFFAHVFNGILVAQPVRPFYRIIHVETPIIFAHIAQRGADAALRGDRMATCGEDLADTSRT